MHSRAPRSSSPPSCGGRLVRRADAAAKRAQEVQRLEFLRVRVEQLARGDLRVDRRVAGRHAHAARLGDRQRAHRVRAQRRRIQRDDRAVGVPDEVRAVAQQLGDQRRLGLEVAARQRRAGGEARPVGQHQRPAVGQRQLMAPRALRADDAAVHEHHARSLAVTRDVEVARAHGRACASGALSRASAATATRRRRRRSSAR